MNATRNRLAAAAWISFLLGTVCCTHAQPRPPLVRPLTPEPPPQLRQDLITQTPPQSPENSLTPARRIELFNGTNFDGWTFCMKNHAEPTNTWSVANGVIHCTGQPIGYLRTEKSFHDYQLTVEWRFVKLAPKADNTGVLFHMQLPDKIWPKCLQVQGKHDHQGDLFLMAGAESKEHRGMDANTPLPKRGPANEKPVGEWDTVVAVCRGNSVQAFVNGRLMNETTECTVSSGFIGIQSEGGELEIRKMVVEPLP